MTTRVNATILRRGGFALAAVAASSFAGCAPHADAAAPKGPPPTSVMTGKVTRGAIVTYAAFDGQVSPLYQTTLSTAEAGTVAAVNVTEGDFVRRGQLLASLDTRQLQASLRADEATVRADEAQLEHSRVAAPIASQQYSSAVASARQNLAAAINSVRTARAALVHDDLAQQADRQLLEQQYVSRETYEAAVSAYVSSRETLRSDEQAVVAQQAALRTAQTNTDQRREDQATIAQNIAGLQAARANAELARAQIAQSSIVAPFDGQITQRLLDPGAYAGASSGIFQLAQLSRVYVVANVPDVDLPTIKRGKAVTFTTPSIPGRTFTGTVADINLTPTSGTLSYRIRLLQPNPDLALRGGMFVNVSTVRARHDNVLLVPASALVVGNSGTTVFTVEGQQAKSIPVNVGLQTDKQAEISGANLAPGASVILAPPSSLRDGAPVIPPGAKPPGGPGGPQTPGGSDGQAASGKGK